MAFNIQEKEIIRAGIKENKSVDEIKNAVALYRTGYVPPPKYEQASPSNILTDVGIGAAKGLGSTLKSMSDFGQDVARFVTKPIIGDVAEKTPEEVALDEKINKSLKAENTAQLVGKGIEIGAEFLTPLVGPKLIRSGIQLTKEGAGIVKEVGEVAEKAVSYTSSRFPKLLGIFSGESDDVVRNALRNPRLADEGIERGDEALRLAIKEGAENSIKIRSTFVKAHQVAKKEILGQYGGILEPKNNVIGIFNDLLERNGVQVLKDGTLDFTTSKIVANPGEITKINNAYQALKRWEKFTIESLDDYKQLVGRLTRFADEAGVPSKSPLLGSLYNELNKIALNRLPEEVAKKYSTLNKNFSDNIELYDDLVDAFNSGDPFVKLANALGKNKDTLRGILEFYAKQEGGKDVLPIVAGRELAMEKTAAFGFLNPRSWIDLLISPKTQAKVITKLGRLAPQLQK